MRPVFKAPTDSSIDRTSCRLGLAVEHLDLKGEPVDHDNYARAGIGMRRYDVGIRSEEGLEQNFLNACLQGSSPLIERIRNGMAPPRVDQPVTQLRQERGASGSSHRWFVTAIEAVGVTISVTATRREAAITGLPPLSASERLDVRPAPALTPPRERGAFDRVPAYASR